MEKTRFFIYFYKCLYVFPFGKLTLSRNDFKKKAITRNKRGAQNGVLLQLQRPMRLPISEAKTKVQGFKHFLLLPIILFFISRGNIQQSEYKLPNFVD